MFGPTTRFANVVKGLLLLAGVIAMGTVGFMLLEDYGWLDAVYMTIITVSTVGFREVGTLHRDGQIFTLLLIISGLTVMTYTLSALGQVIVEGSFQRFVGRQRMLRDIDTLKDHYVICGHGRMGQILCGELIQEKVPFVVIEGNADEAEALATKGVRVLEGDATVDDILEKAGIKRAKGLVAVVSSDVDNLYITLSAREMCRQDNPELYILSRATDHQAKTKITRAGADRVISPYHIGGMRLVQALLRPTVYDFVDIATQSRGLDLMFEELSVGTGSSLDHVSLRDSKIRQAFNIVIIAAKKADGEMVFNPGPEYFVEAGDVLIALGNREQLSGLATVLA